MLWPPLAADAKGLHDATFAGDGLVTQHGSDFLDEELFQRAYHAGKATGSWWNHDLQWRAYVVCWAAARGATLEGDFVECGVHRGGYSRMLAEYVALERLPEKALYLLDTFSGIPDRFNSSASAQLLASAYGECHEDVVRTFSPYPNAVVVRGVIPDILPEVPVDKVCYLSIDLNCAEPTVAAAEYFYSKMTAGAVMVLDDYNFRLFADQKVAMDDFARRAGTSILSLPTGQGLLIKT